METIGNKICNARRNKGFSQERLAEEAGISLRTLQRIEKSETRPHGHTLKSICSVLDLQVEDLMEYGKTENNQDLSFLHLSVLSDLVIPLGGLILPLILWMNQKHRIVNADAQGKNIINFQIIYVLVNNMILLTGCFMKITHKPGWIYYFIAYGAILLAAKAYAIWAAVKIRKNPAYLFYPNWIRFVK